MKKLPEWSTQYAVGVPELDEQHARLFTIARRLIDACGDEKPDTRLLGILTELKDYTLYHFRKEEEVMAAAGYKGLEYHRQMHEFMAARLDFLTKQLRHGLLEKNELIEFMESWLTEHIIMEDMRYIPAVTAAEFDKGYP
ncbi:MAG: bacteriohemerythrin [Turneriella sp.]